jgi:hypothetical protein
LGVRPEEVRELGGEERGRRRVESSELRVESSELRVES